MVQNSADKPSPQENGFLTDSTNSPKLKHTTRTRVLVIIGIILAIVTASFMLYDFSSRA